MASHKAVRIPPPPLPTTDHENRVYIHAIIKLTEDATVKDVPIFNAFGKGAHGRTETDFAKKHMRNLASDQGNFLRIIRVAENTTAENLDRIKEHGKTLAYRLNGDLYKPVESEVIALIERMRSEQFASEPTSQPPNDVADSTIERTLTTPPQSPPPSFDANAQVSDPHSSGAGFGDPAQNREVEEAAIAHVTESYQRQGFSVISREHVKGVGYDLLAKRGEEEWHLEVKGVRGGSPEFIITEAEVKCAESDPQMRVLIVVNALEEGRTLVQLSGPEFLQQYDLRPLAYRATRRKDTDASSVGTSKTTDKSKQQTLEAFDTFESKLLWLLKHGAKRRISQVELARRLGCTPVWINNIIRGHREPSDDLLKKIADFFGIPAISLFSDSRKKSLGIKSGN